MIKLSGLWKEHGKTGDYLKGKLNGFTALLVFPVTDKKPDSKGPDYVLYLDQIEQKKDTQGGQSGQDHGDQAGGFGI